MKMINVQTKVIINVTEHIIIKNFWEYFVTDDKQGEDTVRCLVLGFETEIGDVYLPEIKPYIISRTKNFDEVMPAPGWEWMI